MALLVADVAAAVIMGSILAFLVFWVPILRACGYTKLNQLDYFALTGVPAPQPLPDFDITNTKPRPYRPFRWKYFQNMAIKKMEPDWWLELESTYVGRIKQRVELFQVHTNCVVDQLPGSEIACVELMEMVIQFLCARYPNQFKLGPRDGLFNNLILNKVIDSKKTDPLMFLLQNVPEDFLIVQESPETGLYHLVGGIACSQIGWDFRLKMGKALHEIHEPVPDYKERLQASMDRYFSKLPVASPIQRGAWGIEVGEPLFLQADDPNFAIRQQRDPGLDISDLRLRVDWQTLRRLPQSKAVVINFKAFFTPLAELRKERYIPRLLLKILTEGDREIMKYKGTWYVEHKVVPALREWAAEQEEKGWVPKDWVERTLDEDPFFPGWESG